MENAKKFKLTKLVGNVEEIIEDPVAVEKLLNLYVNGRHFAALVHSPGFEQELVIGFLYTRQLIRSFEDIQSLSFPYEDVARVILKTDAVEQFSEISIMTSGCGRGSIGFGQLDGLKPIAHVSTGISGFSDLQLEKARIVAAMREFDQVSMLFRETGGVHGCALFDEQQLIVFREDVGRHNAVDKVIGYAVMNGVALKNKGLLSSGRISVDMVVKAAVARTPIIASRSAPTSLAIELCEKLNLTLIGFVRGNRMNLYCGPSRIK